MVWFILLLILLVAIVFCVVLDKKTNQKYNWVALLQLVSLFLLIPVGITSLVILLSGHY